MTVKNARRQKAQTPQVPSPREDLLLLRGHKGVQTWESEATSTDLDAVCQGVGLMWLSKELAKSKGFRT